MFNSYQHKGKKQSPSGNEQENWLDQRLKEAGYEDPFAQQDECMNFIIGNPLAECEEWEKDYFAGKSSQQEKPLLISDNQTAQEGQMSKSEFLDRLESELLNNLSAQFDGSGFSEKNCPWLKHIFRHYRLRGASYLEKSLINYLGEKASTADGYIQPALSRVSESVRVWMETGEITGVPAEIPKGFLKYAERDAASFRARMGKGKEIDPGVKSRMENALGTSLGDVKIHTDEHAAKFAEEMDAKAVTMGEDIAFASNMYQPGTTEGDILLAHELMHTLQQQDAAAGGGMVEEESEAMEQHAELSLWQVMQGKFEQIQAAIKGGLSLQRCSKYGEEKPLDFELSDKNVFPTESLLFTNLKKKTEQERKQIIDDYLNLIKPDWIKIQSSEIINILDKAKEEEKEYRKDIKGHNPSIKRAPSGIAKSEPEKYSSYMSLEVNLPNGQKQIDEFNDEESTIIAINLLKGIEKSDTYATTPELTLSAVMNIRRLEDSLIRWIAMENTQKETGFDYNEIMALYRAEGNMGIPNSYGTIVAGIPSGRKGAIAKTYLNTSGGRDISNMVILFTDKYSNMSDSGKESFIKNYAIIHWFLQIAGLDQAAANIEIKSDVEKTAYSFAKWSVKNWKAAGKIPLAEKEQTSLDNAATRWKTLFNDMEFIKTTKPSDPTKEMIGALPRTPQLLISTILTEALMLLHRYKNASEYDPLSGPGTLRIPNQQVPIEFAYLHYNMQTKDDPKDDIHYKKKILMSAIIAASKSTNVQYSILKESIINFSGLRKLLSLNSPTVSEWPNVISWINNKKENLDLLSQFISSAGRSDWISYGGISKKGSSGGSGAETGGHRGAVSRFMMMNEFYKRLLE